jgi:hypothetical protein
VNARRHFLWIAFGGALASVAAWLWRGARTRQTPAVPNDATQEQHPPGVQEPTAVQSLISLSRIYAIETLRREIALFARRQPTVLDRLRQTQLPADDGEFLSHFRAQVLADFRAGRTAEMDGWLLSYSELKLCEQVTRPSL